MTTLVTTTDEDELSRVQSVLPPNVITVESEHVVEVESGRVSEIELEAQMGGRVESTEKLFQKT